MTIIFGIVIEQKSVCKLLTIRYSQPEMKMHYAIIKAKILLAYSGSRNLATLALARPLLASVLIHAVFAVIEKVLCHSTFSIDITLSPFPSAGCFGHRNIQYRVGGKL